MRFVGAIFCHWIDLAKAWSRTMVRIVDGSRMLTAKYVQSCVVLSSYSFIDPIDICSEADLECPIN